MKLRHAIILLSVVLTALAYTGAALAASPGLVGIVQNYDPLATSLTMGNEITPGNAGGGNYSALVLPDVTQFVYVSPPPNTIPTTYGLNSGIGATMTYNASIPLAAVNQACSDGYNQNTGAWDGATGFIAASGPEETGLYGIGYNTANEYGWNTFGGVNVDYNTGGGNSQVLIRQTMVGDTTLKGFVDYDNDYTNWEIGYSASLHGAHTDWAFGDFFYTGYTDYDNDYASGWEIGYSASLHGTYLPLGDPGQAETGFGGNSLGGLTGGGGLGASMSVTPEPGTVVLLLAGLVAIVAMGGRRFAISLRSSQRR
jgi:hypothetical protein